jgi:hypothetical protein
MFGRFSIFPFLWVLVFLIPIYSYSQEDNFQSYLKTQDVVVLDEKLNIIVSGQKSYLIEVEINKEVRYQINNPEGAALLDTIIIPEPFDETYILHAPQIRRNRSSISGLRFTRFSATVEKPDGSIQTVEPPTKTTSQRIITTSLGMAYFNEYYFDKLKPGDILTISYSYSFPFNENLYKLFSTRVFFHSRYPRLSYDFSLTHSSFLEIDTLSVNLCPPVFKEENSNKTYSWHMANLPGCLAEPGSRPYKELPHFIFSLKPYELLYQHFNSFKEEFVPLWYFLCYDREEGITYAVVDQSIGAKDKDNLVYEKIARRFLTMAGPDLNGVKRLQYFQRWMADSVKYKNSALYYDNQENYKISRPGQELQGGIMEDYGIETAYASMILKLGLEFFTAYPVDIRCGEMSATYFAPMYDNDLAFAAILKTNILAFILPFSEINQYYCEELPFYYEDIPVILINSFDFGGYKINMLDSARIVRTPPSQFPDNLRRVRGIANINLEAGTTDFSSAITLAGQYSTLCRFSYLNKPTDPTINPQYNQKVWEIGKDVSVKNLNVGKTDLYFPFSTSITVDYSCNSLIEKTGEGYNISIKNWLNPVIPSVYDTLFRFTDFYPDFLGSDSYIYQLVFNQNITLTQTFRNISLNNEYGSFTFSVQQQAENKILVSCNFSCKKSVISKEKMPEVIKMFREINRCKNLVIQVVPATGQ